ncbi:hypothetical protein [Nitrospirillum amazonense]|uniref:hypothetical protein n=1 Tax=Nitrospirillum amazonense TaxID=28077 RepID=UPI0011A4C216|nr:hypothetical protein [Nitrospirillum amazonense]
MSAQENLVKNYNSHITARIVAPYAASVLFASIAASLIIFAPQSRETAANFSAAALLVVALGIAGFTRFRAKAPGIELSGERTAAADGTLAPANVAQSEGAKPNGDQPL